MSKYDIPPSLLPYLTGQKADYGSLQKSIIDVNIAFIVIITLTAGLRFVVRFHMLRAAGLDDLFMVLALIFALLLSASSLIGVSFGLGKHLWNLDANLLELPADVGRITKTLYGCYLAYSTAITFTKLSIMATYIRVFPTKLVIKYTAYGVGVVVVSFWIVSIFVLIFNCVPVEAAWDYTIRNPRCINVVKYFYISAGFNIATDLLLCFLPLPTIWSLKMSRVQRVIVCVIFGMGSFACVASVLRLTQLRNLGGYDVTYQTVGSLNWSVVEVGTAIICTSLSALRPLATRCLPGFFSHFATQQACEEHGTRVTESTSKIARDPSMASRSGADSNIYVMRSFDITEPEELPIRHGSSDGEGSNPAPWTADSSRPSS